MYNYKLSFKINKTYNLTIVNINKKLKIVNEKLL